LVLRIFDEHAHLIIETRRQVKGEVLPLAPPVQGERSDHRQSSSFRKFGECRVLPEDDRRNDGEDLRFAHQPLQRIHRGAR